jgi:hypothetical protein
MTLEDLIRALSGDNPRGPVRREREPMPQAPARYAGQAGALRREPIPSWVTGEIAQPLAEQARTRARTRQMAPAMPPHPVGPGGVVSEPPAPWEGPPAPVVSLSSTQGRYPADGNAGDWMHGPPTAPPRGSLFVANRGDPEPWRSPMDTERMQHGDPARRGGFGPAAAAQGQPGIVDAGVLREDDLDAQFRAALARARDVTTGARRLKDERRRGM